MASITTRAGKGTPLTNAELDANFSNLNTELGQKLPLAGGTLTGNLNITASGTVTNTWKSGAANAWLVRLVDDLNNDGYSAGASTLSIIRSGNNYNSIVFKTDGTVDFPVALTHAGSTVLDASNYTSYAMSGAGYSANQNLNTSSNVQFGTVTLTTDINLARNDGTTPALVFQNLNGLRWIYSGGGNYYNVNLGVNSSNQFTIGGNTTLHAGNYSSYALPLSGGTVDGVRIGSWTGSSTYKGIYYTGMVGSEYMIINRGDNTYISAVNGYSVYIRGGANSSTYEIGVSGSSRPTVGGNVILDAGNSQNYKSSSLYSARTSNVDFNSLNTAVDTFVAGTNYIPNGGAYNQPVDGDHHYLSWGGIEGANVWGAQIDINFYDDRMWFRRQHGSSWQGWRSVLHDGNYTSYSPSLTGSGASGSWGISVTGSARLLDSAHYIARTGTSGNLNTDFQNVPAGSMRHAGDDPYPTNNPGGTWWFYDHYRHSNSSNYWGTQVAWGWEDNSCRLAQRNVSGNSWSGWVYYLNSGNYTSYAPSLTGSGASGTWGISITGTSRGVGTSDPAIGTGGLWVATSSGLNVARNNTAYTVLDAGNYSSFVNYGNPSSRGVYQITNWNQQTYQNAHFLSSEAATSNAPSTDYTYGFQTAFHRDGASYRTQMVTSLYSDTSIWVRNSVDGDSWRSWKLLLHSGNYSSYALPLSGGQLSGDLQLVGNYLRFDQTGTRSWNLRATGGNLDLNSGDGSGSFRYNGNTALHAGNYTDYGDGRYVLKTGDTMTGTLKINTSGSSSGSSHFIIKRSGASEPGSFGSYDGSWRSSIEVWNNDTTKMLFMNPPENNFGYSILKSVNGGMVLDVGSNGGTRVLIIEAGGNSRFTSSLSVGASWTDTTFGVAGESHFTNAIYLDTGNTLGNKNTWSGRLYSTGGTTYINTNQFEVNRYGYGAASPALFFVNTSGGSINGNTILHAGNYTSYTPAFLASGEISDLSAAWTAPGSSISNGLRVYRFQSSAAGNPNPVDNANWLFNIYSHASGGTASYGHQWTGHDDGSVYVRNVANGGFGGWRRLIDTGNYSSYALPLSGGSLTGRLYTNNWIEFTGYQGLYEANNAAYFYSNTASYGAWRVAGSRNGWGGISFDGNNGIVTLMMNPNSDHSGFHNNNYGWQFYWAGGTMHCFKSSYGGGTDAIVLDSANYSSYALPLSGGTVTGPTYFRSNPGNGVYLASVAGPPLQAYSNDGGAAYMSFHRSGAYAVNFGLDPDNVLRIGGWSAGGSRWVLDMAGNETLAGSSRAPVFYDSNDTSYFIDPNNSGGVALQTIGEVKLQRNDGQTTHFNYSNGGGSNYIRGVTYFDNASIYTYSYLNSYVIYDQNNSWYYFDGDGTTNLNTVTASRFGTNHGSQNPNNSHPGYGLRVFYSWNEGQANNASSGYSNGISIGSHPSNTAYGFQIVQNMWDDDLWIRRYNGAWQSWWRLLRMDAWQGNSYIASGGAHYGTIYYDSNDSGYYCAPAAGTGGYGLYTNSNIRNNNDNTALIWGNDGNIGFAKKGGYTGCIVTRSDVSIYFAKFNQSSGPINPTTVSSYTQTNIAEITPAGAMILAGSLTQNGSPSDERLKENVAPIEGALAKVLQLQGVTFDWKEGTKQRDFVGLKEDIGFIAQRVEEVVPVLVKADEDGTLALRDRGIIALLVESIKEQQQQIEAMRAEIAALKTAH